MTADEAYLASAGSNVYNFTTWASPRYPEADVRSIDFSKARGLDR